MAFDDNGDRIFAEYDVINVQYMGLNNSTHVSVGQYFYPAVSICIKYIQKIFKVKFVVTMKEIDNLLYLIVSSSCLKR